MRSDRQRRLYGIRTGVSLLALAAASVSTPSYGWDSTVNYGTAGTVVDPLNGNDGTGTGTFAAPYKTLAAAKTALGAGGGVIALRGTAPARESIQIGSDYTIQRYSNEDATITGADILTGLTISADTDGGRLDATNYVNIYRVTVAMPAHGKILGLNIMEGVGGAAVQLPISTMFGSTPDHPGFIADNTSMISGGTFTLDGSGYITDIASATAFGSRTSAQVVDGILAIYDDGNDASFATIASFDDPTDKATLDIGQNIKPHPTGDLFNFVNDIAGMTAGTWTARDAGGGNVTIYVWPIDAGNIASGIQYCTREYGIEFATASDDMAVKGIHVYGIGGDNTGYGIGTLTGVTTRNRVTVQNCRVSKTMTHSRPRGAFKFQYITDLTVNNLTADGHMKCRGFDFGVITGGTARFLKTDTTFDSPCTISTCTNFLLDWCDFYFGARSPHANQLQIYSNSDSVAVTRCKWREVTGFVAINQTSDLWLLANEMGSVATGDANRKIVDQSNNIAPDPNGAIYYLHNKMDPADDAYTGGTYNAISMPVFSKTVTGCTAATPGVVTSVGHSLSTGDVVHITGVGGITGAEGRFFVTVLTADTFELDGSTTTGTYTTGGVLYKGDLQTSHVHGNIGIGWDVISGSLLKLGTVGGNVWMQEGTYQYYDGDDVFTTVSATLTDIAGGDKTLKTNGPGGRDSDDISAYVATLAALFPGVDFNRDIDGYVVDWSAPKAGPRIPAWNYLAGTPSLSLPTESVTGATTADGGFTTDMTMGQRFTVAQLTSNTTPPTAAQIVAGTDSADVAADWADNDVVTTTTPSWSATGLTADAEYKFYSTQRSPTLELSAVLASAAFTPTASENTQDMQFANGGTSWLDFATLPNAPASPTSQMFVAVYTPSAADIASASSVYLCGATTNYPMQCILQGTDKIQVAVQNSSGTLLHRVSGTVSLVAGTQYAIIFGCTSTSAKFVILNCDTGAVHETTTDASSPRTTPATLNNSVANMKFGSSGSGTLGITGSIERFAYSMGEYYDPALTATQEAVLISTTLQDKATLAALLSGAGTPDILMRGTDMVSSSPSNASGDAGNPTFGGTGAITAI